MKKVSKLLDLESIPCPLNVVKCKLALEKLSADETLIIHLDKGEPEIMVKRALKEMKFFCKTIEEDQKTIKLKIVIAEKQLKGLVTKKFNEFYLVEIKQNENFDFNKKFLCKLRKSVNFRNQFVFVGDEVILNQIDLKSQRAIIESLVKRTNLLERPSVANISNICVICSVEEPRLTISSK